MKKTNPSTIEKLIVIVILFITTWISLFYMNEFHRVSAFIPAAGLYTAFFYVYRKQIFPYIIASLLLANLLFRFIFVDEIWWNSVLVTVLFVIGNLIEMVLFNYLIDHFKLDIKKLSNRAVGAHFVTISIVVVLSGSIIPTLTTYALLEVDNIAWYYLQFAMGNFLGILLFGSVVLYSVYRDNEFSFALKKTIKTVVYLTLYGFSMYFIFGHSGNDFLTLQNFQIWLMVFYVYSAFNFPYRMTVVNNLLFLLFAYVFHMRTVGEADFTNQAALIGIYLTILSMVNTIVKNILDERQQNFDDLVVARSNIEQIIVSINGMFMVQNKLPQEIREFASNYIIDMFHLACDIYPKFDHASCFIKGEDQVIFLAAKQYDIKELNDMKFDPDKFYWYMYEPHLVRDEETVEAIHNQNLQDEYLSRYPRIKESLRFSVQLGEKETGGMSFDITEGSSEEFDEADLSNFKSFQNVVNSYYTVGIQNNQNNTLKDDIVHSLVRTLERYDSYTGSHSEDVSAIAVDLGKRLGLSQEDIRILYWAGLVHDIGKIGVDPSILNKPNKLSEEEYDIIKSHTIVGYDILSKSSGLQGIAKVVRHHHEWWNGQGYPDHKRQMNVPYLSQILHVADAVSAMSVDRVYKKAMTGDEIIGELSLGLGKQFSPKVAKAMIQLIQENDLGTFRK